MTGDRRSLRIRIIARDHEFMAIIAVPLFTIHARFKVSVLAASGKRYEFACVEFDFGDEIQEVSFGTNVTKLMLDNYKSVFLPSGSLSLEFECILLSKISFSRLLEEHANFVNTAVPVPLLPSIKPEPTTTKVIADIDPRINSDSPSTASQSLKNIYDEGFLSDFSLQVQDRTFPVHKVILSARSSVFRAMFDADMKEKESGQVDIPDVDPDTIQRMLQFVYSDTVQEDMNFESASNLYVAADKYAMEPLKLKCSDILKSGLSSSSVLGVLLLADTHLDEDMRVAALDFILENDKEVFTSKVWTEFAEEHNKLAFDTIQKVYLKKVDG